MLYHRSGLLGVSGISGDMRDLAVSEQAAAHKAVNLFVYRLCGEIGRLTAALGGLDGLVFTAGIGEHDPRLRAEICRRLPWLGIVLDPGADARGQSADGALRLSREASAVAVWVVPTDEEAMIASHTRDVFAA